MICRSLSHHTNVIRCNLVSSSKTTVIVNPQAQHGTVRKKWPKISSLLQSQWGHFETKMTKKQGDGTCLTQQAIAEGSDCIVAVGGDGTINEVVNGFFKNGNPTTTARLGIIPMGTGDDFRKTANIPSDIKQAAHIIQQGKTQPIDIGKLEFTSVCNQKKTTMFVNVASFGLSGLVVKCANKSSKRLGGKLTFFLATLRSGITYKNQHVQLTWDDGQQEDKLIHTVAVANGNFFGGGMNIAPDADVSDGLFDVVSLGNLSFLEFMSLIPLVYQGTHIQKQPITCKKTRSINVTSRTSEKILIEADGETIGKLPATFSMIPHAIQLCVPATPSSS